MKKFITTISFLALSILIIAYFVKSLRLNEPTIANTNNQNYIIASSTKPGWKTYTSQTHHFSIDYPENFVFDDTLSPSSSTEYEIVFKTEPDGMGIFNIRVVSSTKLNQDILKTYHPSLEVDSGVFVTSTSQFIKLNGQSALQYRFGYPYAPDTKTFFTRTGTLYTVSQRRGSDPVQKAMLNSFTFTE